MRFSSEGPSIPDALLEARDQGRVVFFCGAGVSRARAALPDFFGLAESVIRELGVSPHDGACKVLNKAKELSKELDVTGLISADRVFSLLERDFDPVDIQAAVARSLAPKADVDRSAHRVLRRLSRSPDGKTRIVTTNFDRLFEDEGNHIPLFKPPRLPDLSRRDEIDGIVYLHGRSNREYTGPDGDGFVLSSSDFGHAYLSEGWATEFFREVIRKYVVVFLGYSAEDPPVHYLLEGMHRKTNSQNDVYAFQSQESDEVIARWQHKGVTAIPYSPDEGHHALWNTLNQWAIRADDPVAWRQSILDLSKSGPRNLQPYERGQVAHIVSSLEGARTFVEAAPSAEWLCVFDPTCRYQSPGSTRMMDSESPIIQPFSLYGLDSELPPKRSDDNVYSKGPELPPNSWDAFALNRDDLRENTPSHFSSVRSPHSSQLPRLPNRLTWLGNWFANVSTQPAALWWAARQESLHSEFRRGIEWHLTISGSGVDEDICAAWQSILHAWDHPRQEIHRDWYPLKRELDSNGWSSARARRLIDLTTPYLKVGPRWQSRPVPPTPDEECLTSELIKIEVECPVLPQDVTIPDEWIPRIVKGLRQNIESAVRLCEEVGDRFSLNICPIERDDSPDVSPLQRQRDLSGCVITFAEMFERLIVLNLQSAKEELFAWPSGDLVFDRLRLWACGKTPVATPHRFAQVVQNLSDEVFWGSYHQRDLLVPLAKRWTEMSKLDRQRIESRVLRGPKPWDGEDDASFRQHRAWEILKRLQWMKMQKCEFTFVVEEEIAKWRRDAPSWRSEHAESAAESREIRGGWGETDTDCTALTHGPIASILSNAQELSGYPSLGRMTERDPFEGLCTERPKRAYLALAHAAKNNEFPKWAWEAFLNSPAREKDTTRFSAIISARLFRLPNKSLSDFAYSATSWLRQVSKSLSADYPKSFDRAVERLTTIVQKDEREGRSAVSGSNGERDWHTEAINSPVGHLVMAILQDARIERDTQASVESILRRMSQFLELPGDQRRYAIDLVSRDLNWFYRVDPKWTSTHILPVLKSGDLKDQDSFWTGFLLHPRVNSSELYRKLKEGILIRIRQGSGSGSRSLQSLANLILLGWNSSDDEGTRCVSNSEFRDALLRGGDDFRIQVLRRFQGELERELRDSEAADRTRWQAKAVEFFQTVWPRQRLVKTSQTIGQLSELLLSHCETFDALFEVVVPLLTSIEDGGGMHLHYRSEVEKIAKSRPGQFLQLLLKILPANVGCWPYGIGESLDWIIEADEKLLLNTDFIELRRQWKAR